MAIKKIDDTILSNIANAIRGKTGDTAAMKPAAMAALIESIEAGGVFSKAEIIDVTRAYDTSGGFNVRHSLGVVPDGYLLFQAEPFAVPPESSDSSYYVHPFSFAFSDVTIYAQTQSSGNKSSIGFFGSAIAGVVNATGSGFSYLTRTQVQIPVDDMYSFYCPAGYSYKCLVYKW